MFVALFIGWDCQNIRLLDMQIDILRQAYDKHVAE